MTRFREARREDVAAIVALLADDELGRARETGPIAAYLAAFDAMAREAGNRLVVGEREGRIVASYQISFLTGLSLRAIRRAQIESVRVAADQRGRGIGHALMADAEARARAAGCGLMQLTTQKSRTRARRFYESLGFVPSHVGYKRRLD